MWGQKKKKEISRKLKWDEFNVRFGLNCVGIKFVLVKLGNVSLVFFLGILVLIVIFIFFNLVGK